MCVFVCFVYALLLFYSSSNLTSFSYSCVLLFCGLGAMFYNIHNDLFFSLFLFSFYVFCWFCCSPYNFSCLLCVTHIIPHTFYIKHKTDIHTFVLCFVFCFLNCSLVLVMWFAGAIMVFCFSSLFSLPHCTKLTILWFRGEGFVFLCIHCCSCCCVFWIMRRTKNP